MFFLEVALTFQKKVGYSISEIPPAQRYPRSTFTYLFLCPYFQAFQVFLAINFFCECISDNSSIWHNLVKHQFCQNIMRNVQNSYAVLLQPILHIRLNTGIVIRPKVYS